MSRHDGGDMILDEGLERDKFVRGKIFLTGHDAREIQVGIDVSVSMSREMFSRRGNSRFS